jgi:predicted enzyme related to lactoylglutathione lyase
MSGIRKPGEFCWINMLTPQPEQARAFFGKLFGWTYFEMPGLGHGMKVGDKDIGGLFDLNGPQTPPGLPPHIGVMVKVESVDAACEKIKALGGSVKMAFDIMENLRMASCVDANGAHFDLWESRNAHGMEVDSQLHGAPCWFETLTTDAERATKFYSALFGWRPDVKPMPGFDYTVFSLGEVPVAGLMQITPEMGNFLPHWGVYFTVTDADVAAAEAVQLGGTICVPVRDIPNVGRFAGITSPQGVMFYILKASS